MMSKIGKYILFPEEHLKISISSIILHKSGLDLYISLVYKNITSCKEIIFSHAFYMVMDIMWSASQSHFHLSSIFIAINFIHCHSCVMFAMKSMSICND